MALFGQLITIIIFKKFDGDLSNFGIYKAGVILAIDFEQVSSDGGWRWRFISHQFDTLETPPFSFQFLTVFSSVFIFFSVRKIPQNLLETSSFNFPWAHSSYNPFSSLYFPRWFEVCLHLARIALSSFTSFGFSHFHLLVSLLSSFSFNITTQSV